MRHTYAIHVEHDPAYFRPSVKKAIDEINDAMNLFGFPEKIGLTETGPLFTVTVDHELSEEQKFAMIEIMNTEFAKTKKPMKALKLEFLSVS